MLRNQLLIFSRWCQVMLRFEKAMYENPDQDLNKLWWDLVEKYQLREAAGGPQRAGLRQQDPHRRAPVYYHNYMMGELFASQVHATIAQEVYDGADPEHGDLRGQDEGRRVHEEARVRAGARRSTGTADQARDGERAIAKAFAADFRGK